MQKGMTLTQVFVEKGVSGSKALLERPEGAKLAAKLQAGDVLITPKLDRMFRSALDALNMPARFRDAKVSLHMIDLGGDVMGNGIAKLVFTILSAVAEAERDRIRERIRDVKSDQKKRHRYLGGKIPFGWQLATGGELATNQSQQDAIRCMIALRNGGKSLRSIASIMRKAGFQLSHEGVKKIILAHQGC